ncbi:MAG TPA: 4Fe-4S dicluster domain-containing protein [Longilinea sp.]|nr:4Fe-4S dicluster domain-containing protein [Longilinea sp.]
MKPASKSSRGQAKTIRRIRRAVQVIALLLFFGLFIFVTYRTPIPGVSDIFYRFDPLTAITAMLAGRVFLTGLALSAITVIVTLLFGRVWCGWICPMGTTLDIFKPGKHRQKGSSNPPPEKWRMIKYLLLIFILVSALFGNQSLLFLDPVTMMTRTTANAVWPALSHGVYAAEGFLYNFDFLWDGLDVIHQAVIYPIFRDVRPVFPLAVPLFLLFAGIIALNWWAERFWCRYLCPLGGLLGLLSRLSPFHREVKETCTACSACVQRCPTGTIDPERDFASDPAECTVCYNCIETCPNGSAEFKWQLPKKKHGENLVYDPSRREVLSTIGLSAAAAALAQVEPITKRSPADLIRPPGADQVDFEALCIRCNECVRVCPTQGLQASFMEGGWQNLFTPRLTPRIGYCEFNCAACGQACPTGAIPLLSLEEKQHTPIGLARVDRNRCLPWAYNIDCIVCEESCPLADKAIRLEILDVVNGRGDTVTIKRPYVVKELCIGCGSCEYQCPMGGEAAICIFAYTEAGGYAGNDPTFVDSDNQN